MVHVVPLHCERLHRVYDTRFAPSERRTNLYLEPNVFSHDCAPIAKSVLKIIDHMYGVPLEEEVNHIDWLWQYRAQLHLISATYHYGVHYAKHPLHFIPIINHLESLHRQGFVHGDIRGRNMVLLYDDTEGSNAGEHKGWLIDFDCGGKLNSVKYPEGYTRVLTDGVRPGVEGRLISIADDWQSLFGLIIHMYKFIPISYGAEFDEYETKVELLRDTIEFYYNTNPETNIFEKTDYESPAKLLREYLELVSLRYTLRPASCLLKDNEEPSYR